MRNRATLFFQGVLLATVVAAGALILPAPAAAQDVCTPTINSCGCTITTPGSYKIGLAIDSTQGLTPAGACIEVLASYVILDGAKNTVTGPGGDSPTGIGIWVHRNSHDDFLGFRGATLSGWDVGLLIQGRQIVADGVTANDNGTAGVELKRADSIELTNATAESNLNFGLWLKQTTSSEVSNSKTESNGNVGLYLGCADIGPTGAGCPNGPNSRFNYLYTGNISSNKNYGVALDLATGSTIVTNQTPGGGTNGKDDLYDANSSCGTNKWFGDASTATNNQPGGCIK